MFSIKKATLFGITALTTVAMTAIVNVNSAQAAISNRSQSTLNSINFNTKLDNEKSPLTLLPIKRTELISLKRGMVICKPNSVKPHSVSSCKKTDNNQPASVNKPVRQRTNNNQSTSSKNSSTIRRSIRKMQKTQN